MPLTGSWDENVSIDGEPRGRSQTDEKKYLSYEDVAFDVILGNSIHQTFPYASVYEVSWSLGFNVTVCEFGDY